MRWGFESLGGHGRLPSNRQAAEYGSRMTLRRTGLLVPLLLVACTQATPAAPPPPPPPGPAAFLEFARAAPFGTKDLASGSDETLLSIGALSCEAFDSGLVYGRVVQTLLTTNAKPSSAEADALVRASVVNLCPQHKVQLP